MILKTNKHFQFAPAVRALVIQIISCLLVWLPAFGLARSGIFSSTIFVLALTQGVVAAALSGWCRLAPWWLLIQLVFPCSLVVAMQFELPPFIFLTAFVLFLCLYWTTFRTQVPFYPSGRATWKTVEDLLPARDGIRFLDIGSGLGGLVQYLALRRRDCNFSGIELAPLPWLVSLIRAWLNRCNARFTLGDYESIDFGQYDVIFAYLSPAAMNALWHKARAEMRPGTLLLSYEFVIPDVRPQLTVMPDAGGAGLYGWRM